MFRQQICFTMEVFRKFTNKIPLQGYRKVQQQTTLTMKAFRKVSNKAYFTTVILQATENLLNHFHE